MEASKACWASLAILLLVKLTYAQNSVGDSLEFTFYELGLTFYDEVNGIRMNSASLTENYFPGNETDPQLLPNRGLYFVGNSFLEVPEFILSPSQTWDILVLSLPSNSTQTVLFGKSEAGQFEVSLLPTEAGARVAIDYLLNLGDSVPSYGEIPSERWVRLSWTVASQPYITLTVYVDGIVRGTSTLDSPGLSEAQIGSLRVGKGSVSNYFYGYLFSLKLEADALHNLPPLTLQCGCEYCYYNQECLSICLPTEFSSDDCHNCLPECTVGCTRGSDCSLHPDPLCELFFDLRAESCVQCVTGATHTGTHCQCGEHSQPTLERECACVAGYWRLETHCLPCGRWLVASDVTAYFSEHYIELIFEFVVEVDTAGLTCMKLFEQDSLDKFGSNPRCYFLNRSKLVVELGEEFTLSEDTVALNPGILKEYLSEECGIVPGNLIVLVRAMYKYPAPSIKVIGPQGVNYDCEDLYIDAGASSGRLKHKLAHRWTVEATPDIGLSIHSDLVYTNQTLYIPKHYLADATLFVTIVVQNFLGVWSSYSFEVLLVKTGLLSIVFDMSIDEMFFATEYSDYSINSVNSCDHSQDFMINWTLVSIQGNSSAIQQSLCSHQVSDKLLIIPELFVSPYTTLTFEVEASDEVGNTGTLLLAFHTLARELVLLPTRGSGDVGCNQDLFIDLSASYDPNWNSSLDFAWDCFQGATVCSSIILDRSSPCLHVSSDNLKQNDFFTFMVTVTAIYAGGTNTKSKVFDIRVVKDSAPAALIATHTERQVPDVVSAMERLRLECFVDQPELYDYEWVVETGGTYQFASKLNQPSVAIKEHSLSPGFDYVLAVYLSTTGTRHRFSIEFYVNRPPSLGDFLVRAHSLEFAETAVLQASNWIDTEGDYPLSYSFGFTFRSKKFYLNLKDQKSTFYSKLPFSEGLEFWVEVYDQRGDCAVKAVNVTVNRDPTLDLEQLVADYEQLLFSENTNFHELPSLMTILAIRVINEDLLLGHNLIETQTELNERVYNAVIEGITRMLDTVPVLTDQDITTLLSVLELTASNPTLLTTFNIEQAAASVKLMLEQVDSLSHINVRRLLEITEQLLGLDSERVYNHTYDLRVTIGMMVDVQQLYGGEMVLAETFTEQSGGINIHLEHVTLADLDTYSVQVNTVELEFPAGISSTVCTFFPSQAVLVGVITIVGESVPSILDVNIYDSVSLHCPTLKLGEISISFSLPVVSTEPMLADEECVFLDESVSLWNTQGCVATAAQTSQVTCKCNHLSTFSAGEALAALSALPQDSNLKCIGDVREFQKLEHTSVGLYLVSIALGLYIICAVFSWRADNRRAEPDVLETDHSFKDELEEPKALKQLLFEQHALLRVFSKDERQYSRLSLTTLLFLTLFQEVWLIGTFYEHDVPFSVLTAEDLAAVVRGYSWEDFWAMVLSVIITLLVLIVFKTLFRRRPGHSENPESRRNRICTLVGLTCAWLLMGFYTYMLLMFSLKFAKNLCLLWLFNSLLSILFDLGVVEVVKVCAFACCLHVSDCLVYKEQRKVLKEYNQGTPSISVTEFSEFYSGIKLN